MVPRPVCAERTDVPQAGGMVAYSRKPIIWEVRQDKVVLCHIVNARLAWSA